MSHFVGQEYCDSIEPLRRRFRSFSIGWTSSSLTLQPGRAMIVSIHLTGKNPAAVPGLGRLGGLRGIKRGQKCCVARSARRLPSLRRSRAGRMTNNIHKQIYAERGQVPGDFVISRKTENPDQPHCVVLEYSNIVK